MTFEVMISGYSMSSWCWHSWKVLKDYALNKWYIAKKNDFENLR